VSRWNKLAHAVTHAAGSGWTAVAVLVVVAGWLAWGFAGDFSRAWEVAMTCGSPPLLFLMLIVLQRAQNRESRASHLKLNELLLALEEPDEDVVDAEMKSEEELVRLRDEHHRTQSPRSRA
jgi:low affinity Fe/Cu permease